jgi:flagellar biosynthesis/type III secretory pathway chaperone
MIHDDDLKADISGYEDYLVKQFNTMELLVDISREERELILRGSIDPLMKNTEEKEAILDKFSLLEENLRMLLHKIAFKLEIQSESTGIRDILPFLETDDFNRISRLLDGINILVQEARALNLGNQALVFTRVDWLKATQTFIARVVRPEECYRMPTLEAIDRNSPVSSLECNA